LSCWAETRGFVTTGWVRYFLARAR